MTISDSASTTLPGTAPLRLAVVIVSYNTCALLRGCLASLEQAAAALHGRIEIDVIVVDNASSDGSAEMAATDFPGVRLIALDQNLGFAAANNRAFAHLGLFDADPQEGGPQYVLLLNPDTVVTAAALATMVGALEADGTAGVAGARLVYSDGGFQHGAFAFPGVAQVAIDLWLPARMPGAARLLNSRANGRYPQSLWQGDAPFRVDFVLGAALLARSSLLRQLGGLDEGYFMYCEEMDWCMRARQAGWQVIAVPGAEIVHFEGQSSRQVRWESRERLWRSRFRFYAKHRSRFLPWTLPVTRLLLRSAMRRASRAAVVALASGRRDGVDVGSEVRVNSTVSTL